MRTRKKKGDGGLQITQANAAFDAPDFVAACARPARAKADYGFTPQAGTHDNEAKRFTTLQAQFAKHRHTLHQSGPGDGPGPVSYLAERWGMARHLPTLDDADRFLIQVGGAGHDL